MSVCVSMNYSNGPCFLPRQLSSRKLVVPLSGSYLANGQQGNVCLWFVPLAQAMANYHSLLGAGSSSSLMLPSQEVALRHSTILPLRYSSGMEMLLKTQCLRNNDLWCHWEPLLLCNLYTSGHLAQRQQRKAFHQLCVDDSSETLSAAEVLESCQAVRSTC